MGGREKFDPCDETEILKGEEGGGASEFVWFNCEAQNLGKLYL